MRMFGLFGNVIVLFVGVFSYFLIMLVFNWKSVWYKFNWLSVKMLDSCLNWLCNGLIRSFLFSCSVLFDSLKLLFVMILL